MTAAFVADAIPWDGGAISATVQCIRANNPSAMTYTGTNTWVITNSSHQSSGSLSQTDTEHDVCSCAPSSLSPENAPSASLLPCVIIDPAPAGSHVDTILATCKACHLAVAAIVLTHHHIDHTEGATSLQEKTGANIYARDTSAIPQSLPLPSGAFCPFEGAPPMSIMDLPGHSPDSIGILLPEEHLLLTGDVIFRHGPTVVYYPEGHLGSYLATLDVLEDLVYNQGVSRFLPGHGYPIDNPLEIIAATREHRHKRLAQIQQALQQGSPAEANALYEVVYRDTDPRLIDAALRSIKAQLQYLNDNVQAIREGNKDGHNGRI